MPLFRIMSTLLLAVHSLQWPSFLVDDVSGANEGRLSRRWGNDRQSHRCRLPHFVFAQGQG